MNNEVYDDKEEFPENCLIPFSLFTSPQVLFKLRCFDLFISSYLVLSFVDI